MDRIVLELNHIQKELGGQLIIHDASLKLAQGEVIALCGGNGAGKSTLLRMIAGILQPTAGEIRIKGKTWKKDRKEYAHQIGYMPDDYLFGQGLSAEETLAFWASLRKVSSDRVSEVLELVGLIQVRKRKVSSFSKGMRQRLLFAQALLAKPSLLIMDEPTNGLDPYWMGSFVELIRYVKNEGHAIIFSTHQLQIAEAISDYVLFLKEGRIAEEGTTASFIERYGPYGLSAAFDKLFAFPDLPLLTKEIRQP
ncbi:ATP-binding cassette domain-containing protein [Paenibacillus sp. LMG 31456]|uniref:ATP-binding cassette domain-containing protein n=1 Tax=Paenibacillus foliorum TaxID=2654974 RepID=A0A972GUH3_9BACL|nr:ABC transporter ATP-binding protein [Paenibacillus foliorum]NOU94443.1 ATP-binding cassette domain-containing protein [Paenibacillus foliorum]